MKKLVAMAIAFVAFMAIAVPVGGIPYHFLPDPDDERLVAGGGESVEGSGAHTTGQFDQVVRDSWYGAENQTCVNAQDLKAVLDFVEKIQANFGTDIGERRPIMGPGTYQSYENLTLAVQG